MTATLSVSAATRLERDLEGAAEAHALAGGIAGLLGRGLGDGAHAFTRISVYVDSMEEVDAAAAMLGGALGTRARWNSDGSRYRVATVSHAAEVEVVWRGEHRTAAA